MRDHLLVVLSRLHVLGEQVQCSETLSTTHALENVSGLFISSTNPHILTSHQLPGDGKLLLEDVSGWGWLG